MDPRPHGDRPIAPEPAPDPQIEPAAAVSATGAPVEAPPEKKPTAPTAPPKKPAASRGPQGQQRKPAKRAYPGLAGRTPGTNGAQPSKPNRSTPVGLPPEELPQAQTPKPPAFTQRLTGRDVREPAPPVVVEPSTAPVAPNETAEGLMATMLADYDRKKRGRPRIHANDAEKMRRHREKKAEREARLAAEKAFQDKIDAILREHRDSAGRFHDERSGGDAAAVAEWQTEQQIENGGKVRPSGYDPKRFENEKRTPWDLKETDFTWVERQNFYLPSKWDKRDREEFIQSLAVRIFENGETLSCTLCPYKAGTNPRLWRDESIEHLNSAHKKFLREMIRRFRPNPVELRKKPPRCTEGDHRRWAQVFADRLPLYCRFCKKLIFASEPAGNIVTGPATPGESV